MTKLTITTEGERLSENTPNAAKLLSSLRHLDYSSVSAICDIVDNSIDAGATEIHVDIIADGKRDIESIEIWDNGTGMTSVELIESMRLGSKSHKDLDHHGNLGRYGMGMITASHSIGKKLTVETYKDGHVFQAIQDLDFIAKHDKFQIHTKTLTGTEKKEWITGFSEAFEESKSGTIVIIDNIDRWGWSLLSASEKNISQTLGQVYRKFIEGGEKAKRKIYVNGDLVPPIDPVLDFNPELLDEHTFKIENEDVTVKLYLLPDNGKAVNTSNSINMQNQGFYLLRNNREIATGETINLFKKHNDYNFFRAELFYPATLDEVFNTGFTKQRIGIADNQSVKDKLRDFVQTQLKFIKKRAQKARKDRREKKEDFSQVESFIKRKTSLLTMPPSENGEDGRTHTVKFSTESNSPYAPLYNCEVKGRTTTIIWNIDHPFYTDFIVPYESDKNVLHPICFLIFTLATQELSSTEGSEQLRILENLRVQSSQDLRVLMKS